MLLNYVAAPKFFPKFAQMFFCLIYFFDDNVPMGYVFLQKRRNVRRQKAARKSFEYAA